MKDTESKAFTVDGRQYGRNSRNSRNAEKFVEAIKCQMDHEDLLTELTNNGLVMEFTTPFPTNRYTSRLYLSIFRSLFIESPSTDGL